MKVAVVTVGQDNVAQENLCVEVASGSGFYYDNAD